jgi:hypothetical protein
VSVLSCAVLFRIQNVYSHFPPRGLQTLTLNSGRVYP